MPAERSSKLVGVDGCRGGWVAAWLHQGQLSIDVYADMPALWQAHQDARTILVDMPIGLPSDQPRQVEVAARLLLPGKAATVFPVPCREAVYAPDYASACEINQACFGKRLSRQAWYLCPKIRDLDQLLRAEHDAAGRVLEAHPELAFALLNGGLPLLAPKRSAEGRQQRLAIVQKDLGQAYPALQALLDRWPRRLVQPDDAVDALVLLQTLVTGHAALLPTAQLDAHGLQVNLAVPRRRRLPMFR